MDEQTIRTLIRLVEESDIESLEVRKWFRTIRITKSRASTNGHPHAPADSLMHIPIPAAAPPPPTPAPPPPAPSNLIEIKSPMVGTFYRSPAPEAPPFVDAGATVKPGTVICLIEAMKLMNEIEAEQSGRITKVLVENGQPVEFGQVLFLLDPAGY